MRLSNITITLFIIIALLVFLAYRYARGSPYRVPIEQARYNRYDIYLDVRTEFERENLGYYPKSLHIPFIELKSTAYEKIPSRNARILVYCNTGQRARRATELLRRMGYSNVYYIAGPYNHML